MLNPKINALFFNHWEKYSDVTVKNCMMSCSHANLFLSCGFPQICLRIIPSLHIHFLQLHQVWSVCDHRNGFNKCISSCLLSVPLTVCCNAVFHSLYLFSYAHSLSTPTPISWLTHVALICGVGVCSLPAITQLLHIYEIFFSDCAISLNYSTQCVLC